MSKKRPFLRTTLSLAITTTVSIAAQAADRQLMHELSAQFKTSSKSITIQSMEPGQMVGLTGDDGIQIRKRYLDSDGSSTIRYRQTYKGLPVVGDDIVLAYDRSGNYSHAHGAALYGINKDLPDIKPTLSLQQAMELAKSKSRNDAIANQSLRNGQNIRYENEQNKLAIWRDKKGIARLVYALSFVQHADKPSRPDYLIDAKSGQVLRYFDNLQTADATGPGGNEKTGQYQYGTDFPALNVTETGADCTMENTNVRSVNLNHGVSGTDPFVFTCFENTFQQINGAFSPINDAHHFGGVVFDMYNNWIGVPPLTFQLQMRVHYSTNYENAFWDGSAMTFGDGLNTFYPLVSLDVSAHEVSHGFTEQNSNLVYAGKSGGLNEAFSDMAGEAAEFYNQGSNDWKVGEQIFKGSGALRYMDNPPADGLSIDQQSDYFDGLDVHYSSGVYNKAYYLLATTAGWDTRMAFEIYARANMLYWTASTDWDQAGNGVMDAACDLNFNIADVQASLAAVGVTSDVSAGRTCTTGNQSPVAGFSFSATDLSVAFTDSSSDSDGTVASWSWDFGDGNSSTEQNPTHIFAADGTYSVSLTVTDNEGASDSSSQSVAVAVGGVNELPVAQFTASSSDLTVTLTDQSSDSDGSITAWNWDFGDGNLSTSQNPVHSYAAAGTYNVSLTVTDDRGGSDSSNQQVTVSEPQTTGGFTETNLSPAARELLYYTLEVPAGATALDVSTSGGSGDVDLAINFGSTATRNNNVCFAGGAGNDHSCSVTDPSAGTWYITVRGAQASSGVQLDAYWTAVAGGNQAPTADFSFNPTNLEVAFSDLSTDSDGTVDSWSWDFGDGNSATVQNPLHIYAAAGSYTVTLTVTDNGGASSSSSQTISVSDGGGGTSGGFTETNVSPAANQNLQYTIDVPAGATSLVVDTSGGSGDVSLGLNFGSAPSPSNNACLQTSAGNSHNCTITNPAEGTWYIIVRGAAASSGVQLDAYWYSN